MLRPFEFCLSTRSTTVPDGVNWLHEVKYDAIGLGGSEPAVGVRPITRGGYD